MEVKKRTLIVGANGALGTFTLLKLYGLPGLCTLIRPSEFEEFAQTKEIFRDEWYPRDRTRIDGKAFCRNAVPENPQQVGVFNRKTLPPDIFAAGGTVILSTKTYQYSTVLDEIKHVLTPSVVILQLVNGLFPEKALEILCREKKILNPVFRAVIMGGTHFSAGEKPLQVSSGIQNFVIGHWDHARREEDLTRLNLLGQLFFKDRLEVIPKVMDDFRAASLDKILANLVNPISSLTGAVTLDYTLNPFLKPLVRQCILEGLAVADALGIKVGEKEAIVESRLNMFRKAGSENHAHLPSMAQDALRAALQQKLFFHENAQIGVALVEAGKSAGVNSPAPMVQGINLLLEAFCALYNQLYQQSPGKASRFLMSFWIRNRVSLGLAPTNPGIYSQFEGLVELEKEGGLESRPAVKIEGLKDVVPAFKRNFEGAVSASDRAS